VCNKKQTTVVNTNQNKTINFQYIICVFFCFFSINEHDEQNKRAKSRKTPQKEISRHFVAIAVFGWHLVVRHHVCGIFLQLHAKRNQF
jgi:hypothetical protein